MSLGQPCAEQPCRVAARLPHRVGREDVAWCVALLLRRLRKRAKGAEDAECPEPSAPSTAEVAPAAADDVAPTLVASQEEWARADSQLAHCSSFDDSTAEARICQDRVFT